MRYQFTTRFKVPQPKIMPDSEGNEPVSALDLSPISLGPILWKGKLHTVRVCPICYCVLCCIPGGVIPYWAPLTHTSPVQLSLRPLPLSSINTSGTYAHVLCNGRQTIRFKLIFDLFPKFFLHGCKFTIAHFKLKNSCLIKLAYPQQADGKSSYLILNPLCYR